MRDIPALWQRFFAESWPTRISGRISDDALAVYTDYEDYGGRQPNPSYTLIIGMKTGPNCELPEGAVRRDVPAQTYAVFKAKGEPATAVAEAWDEIWKTHIDRAFRADFELCDERAGRGPDSEVDIYIGVR